LCLIAPPLIFGSRDRGVPAVMVPLMISAGLKGAHQQSRQSKQLFQLLQKFLQAIFGDLGHDETHRLASDPWVCLAHRGGYCCNRIRCRLAFLGCANSRAAGDLRRVTVGMPHQTADAKRKQIVLQLGLGTDRATADRGCRP
jgi:hypothetical protein